MLARLYVLLPFSLQVPDGENFIVRTYEERGYRIQIYPPVSSDIPAKAGKIDEITVNGHPATSVNALRIDFSKDQFDRRLGFDCDPPYEFIKIVVNSFLTRLRYVTRAAWIHLIDFQRTTWRLRYLNDDGTELEEEKELVRGRGAINVRMQLIGLTKEVWEDIHDLPSNFEAATWDDLLLDAQDTLPQIGPAVVLAATALEVFIGRMLDKLAERSTVPPDLWKWITHREWLREATTEEQFDELLNVLLGYSLKEDVKLWEAFKNLKTARNTFVHEGVARLGNSLVTDEEARQLLNRAVEIIRTIWEHIPQELQWKEYKHELKVEAKFRFFDDQSGGAT